MTSLLLAVKSTSLDEKKAKPIFDTFLEVQPTFIEEPADTLDGFSKVTKATVKNLDKNTIKETLGWLNDMSAKVDHKNDADVSKVKEILFLLFVCDIKNKEFKGRNRRDAI